MKLQIIYLLLSFIFTASLGKIIIPILKKLKVGQSERKEGPRSHLRKQGTPTMGGILIVVAIVIGSLLFMPIENSTGWVALAALVMFGTLGFVDDYKKVVKKNTDGLNPQSCIGVKIMATTQTE